MTTNKKKTNGRKKDNPGIEPEAFRFLVVRLIHSAIGPDDWSVGI